MNLGVAISLLVVGSVAYNGLSRLLAKWTGRWVARLAISRWRPAGLRRCASLVSWETISRKRDEAVLRGHRINMTGLERAPGKTYSGLGATART